MMLLLGLAYAGIVIHQVAVVQAVPYTSLYFWHPICATLFIVFAILGMASAQSIRGRVAASRSTKEPYVTRHAIYNWLALFSLIGAGATIYLNKEKNNRPHLTTYHALTGAATAAFFLMNVLGGGVLNTVPSLYKYIKFHRAQGYLIFAAVLATHATAVWRGYVGFKYPGVSIPEEYGKYGLVGALGLLLLLTLSRVQLSLLPGGKAKDA